MSIGKRKHVWHQGEWVDITDLPRRAPVFPSIIRDGQDPLVHPCTGQVIDSKSRFREITRAHGCIEIGNEKQAVVTEVKPADVADDIAQAWQQVEQGYIPSPPEPTEGDVRLYG